MKTSSFFGTSILAGFAPMLAHHYGRRTSLWAALILALNLLPAGRVTAQTFTTLHSFTATAGPNATNSDGGGPIGALILSGNTLYGTAYSGGSSGQGTVFALNTDGTGFTNLHSFADPAGANPTAGLILSGDTLYGTAIYGGGSHNGAVFAVNTDGTGFTNLHNCEGSYPHAGLILSGNILYGTTIQGGGSFDGTLFSVHTDGTGYTNLHSFTGGSGGGLPYGGLVLTNNTLYGTASDSSSGNGTVFAVQTDGTGFTNLHSFTALDPIYNTNSDGANPFAGLILYGNTLYGTAQYGGSSGNGMVFAVNTDGAGFTNLHSFTGGRDGSSPQGELILSGTTLYGTTYGGGGSGHGAVFSLSFQPQLSITSAGPNVVLSWPISYAGFSYVGYYLRETANLGSPGGWAAADPFPPTIVDGQYKVTRPMLGPQISYRLAK